MAYQCPSTNNYRKPKKPPVKCDGRYYWLPGWQITNSGYVVDNRYNTKPYHTIPYHTIPYHTIPYRTVPYRTVPYRTVPYRTVPYRTVPYRTVPYRTVPYRTGLHRTAQHRTAPHRTMPYLVSALFTSILVSYASQAVRIKLYDDSKLHDSSPLSQERILELASFCLNITYFTYRGVIYIQKHGAAMRSPVSSIIANQYMEGFDEIALCTAPPLSVWFTYVDNTFTMIHEYHVDEFTAHPNNLDPNIKFTKDPEQDGTLPFLDTCININEDGVHTSHYTVNPPT